jgi:transposase
MGTCSAITHSCSAVRRSRGPGDATAANGSFGGLCSALPRRWGTLDYELYKKRNQVERLFRRLKGFRHICPRFKKLDVVFLAFIYFAFIIGALL